MKSKKERIELREIAISSNNVNGTITRNTGKTAIFNT